MTKSEEFFGKVDVDLTKGFKDSKEKYEDLEKTKAQKISEDPGEVRKRTEELLDEYKRKIKRNEERPEIINVIERNIRIFKEVEDNYEEIVRGLEKECGTDKIDFVLYLFKVRHPCFHMALETNTVAVNPEVKEAAKASVVELAIPLRRTWEELTDLILMGKMEAVAILLEDYYEDLRLAFEEHKPL